MQVEISHQFQLFTPEPQIITRPAPRPRICRAHQLAQYLEDCAARSPIFAPYLQECAGLIDKAACRTQDTDREAIYQRLLASPERLTIPEIRADLLDTYGPIGPATIYKRLCELHSQHKIRQIVTHPDRAGRGGTRKLCFYEAIRLDR